MRYSDFYDNFVKGKHMFIGDDLIMQNVTKLGGVEGLTACAVVTRDGKERLWRVFVDAAKYPDWEKWARAAQRAIAAAVLSANQVNLYSEINGGIEVHDTIAPYPAAVTEDEGTVDELIFVNAAACCCEEDYKRHLSAERERIARDRAAKPKAHQKKPSKAQ